MNKYSVSVVSAKRHLVYVTAESSESAVKQAEKVVSDSELTADYVEVIDVEEIT